MKLQFFHIHDLCKLIDILLENKPTEHIFNVGNKETISIRDWVTLCYDVVGKQAEFVNVSDDTEQRNYFSFYNYEYYLDVTKQYELLENVTTLYTGLKESLAWYINHSDQVNKKPFLEYIDSHL